MLEFGLMRELQAPDFLVIGHMTKEPGNGVSYDYGVDGYRVELNRNCVTLAEVIKSAVPVFYRKGKINCATKTFQALRIMVNKELENIESILPQIVEVLNQGGRAAIISFHSLEDRIIKNFFRDNAKEGKLKLINKKPTSRKSVF